MSNIKFRRGAAVAAGTGQGLRGKNMEKERAVSY